MGENKDEEIVITDLMNEGTNIKTFEGCLESHVYGVITQKLAVETKLLAKKEDLDNADCNSQNLNSSQVMPATFRSIGTDQFTSIQEQDHPRGSQFGVHIGSPVQSQNTVRTVKTNKVQIKEAKIKSRSDTFSME